MSATGQGPRGTCTRCGEALAGANGIIVHAATGRADSTKNGAHYARPSGGA